MVWGYKISLHIKSLLKIQSNYSVIDQLELVDKGIHCVS